MKKEKKLDVNGKRPFGIRDSVAYAAGDLGCNMSFALKGTMALFWTQVMGMGLWYSLLLVIVQVWDAINDPLIGSIIDAGNLGSGSAQYVFPSGFSSVTLDNVNYRFEFDFFLVSADFFLIIFDGTAADFQISQYILKAFALLA